MSRLHVLRYAFCRFIGPSIWFANTKRQIDRDRERHLTRNTMGCVWEEKKNEPNPTKRIQERRKVNRKPKHQAKEWERLCDERLHMWKEPPHFLQRDTLSVCTTLTCNFIFRVNIYIYGDAYAIIHACQLLRQICSAVSFNTQIHWNFVVFSICIQIQYIYIIISRIWNTLHVAINLCWAMFIHKKLYAYVDVNPI